MSEAREAILARVRTALSDRPAPADIPWRYGADVGTGDLGLVERFVERVADYRARVDRIAEADAAQAISAALADARTVIGDPAVQARWPGAAPWVSDTGLSADALDAVDAVVTTATVAIANTGTLVLDHGSGQGRRALSLVPDVHVCVVYVSQIVDDVPNAVARLVDSGSHTRPLTWISGPSATSDIELDRVEGVHGPRTLHVVVLG